MKKLLKSIINSSGLDIVKFNKRIEEYASIFDCFHEFTMIPKEAYLINLEIIDSFKSVEGDFVECGVWKGGMSAGAAALLGKNKMIHLFDSFEGLPPAREIDGEAALKYQEEVNSTAYLDNCAADESFALTAMAKANHKNYKVYKGWFNETLGNIDSQKISILRIDGDWYDSVLVCLEKLFPLLVKGGVVIIDDYYIWDGCSKAVHDFLSQHKLSARIYQKDNRVAYIVK